MFRSALAEIALHVASDDPLAQPLVNTLGLALYNLLTRPVDANRRQQSPGHVSGVQVFYGARSSQLNYSSARTNVACIVSAAGQRGSAVSAPQDKATRTVYLDAAEKPGALITQVLSATIAALRPVDDLPLLSVASAEQSPLGDALPEQLNKAPSQATAPLFRRIESTRKSTSVPSRHDRVLLAIHDDHFSGDQGCLGDLLQAKKDDTPIVELVALERGDGRSASALGNLPGLIWTDEPDAVLHLAASEWIKARAFLDLSERLMSMAHLPDCTVLTRPPEVIDVCQMRHSGSARNLIFHPDPELSVLERRLLTAANPRLQLLTPTTAYRFLRRDDDSTSSANTLTRARRTPLDAMRVGFSLSEPEDESLASGLTSHHYDDTIAYLGRSIISAGGAIAYGGDWRQHGYTELLANLVDAYGRRAAHRPHMLHNYQDAHLDPPANPHTQAHNLGEKATDRIDALLDAEAAAAMPTFASSDTRRVMADALDATVVIGGKARPTDGINDGYLGLFPGILEETWRMLENDKPVYIVGGFGGSAALVASLCDDKIPPALIQSNWDKAAGVAQRLSALRDHPWRLQLGLPESMDAMAGMVSAKLRGYLRNDDSSLQWNGLTVEENRQLLASTDPVLIAALVFKGLTCVFARQSADKLDIELVAGDIIAAEPLDVISLPALSGLPLSGAALRVDQVIDGHLSQAMNTQQALLGVHESELPTDWLHVAALQPGSGENEPAFNVTDAATNLAMQSERFGFEKIGLVLFGGTLVDDIYHLVDTMIESLRCLSGKATIVWHEIEHARFLEIEARIRERWANDIALTTSAGEPLLVSQSQSGSSLIVDYDEQQATLRTVYIPRSGTGIASRNAAPLTPVEMSDLSKGIAIPDWKTKKIEDHRPRYYPTDQIAPRGRAIADLLFGAKHAQALLKQTGGQPVQIIHNRSAASIPFELMCIEDGVPLVAECEVSRRLTASRVTPEAVLAPPLQKGKLNAVLIVDPRNDLPGARKEGKAVGEILKQFTKLIKLESDDATLDAVLDVLPDADIVHYCGHGFFTDEKLRHCGLSLAGADLTLEDLYELPRVPRIAVMNACEVGRLLDHERKLALDTTRTEPAAFAEFFLRSGTQVFAGAHWLLQDRSGVLFAENFYTSLYQGKTVAASMLRARKALARNNNAQWGNYVLYGQGDIRLCRPG